MKDRSPEVEDFADRLQIPEDREDGFKRWGLSRIFIHFTRKREDLDGVSSLMTQHRPHKVLLNGDPGG